MSVLVSKTIYTAMKKSVDNKRKKVAKEVAQLKGMEATLKQMKVAKR